MRAEGKCQLKSNLETMTNRLAKCMYGKMERKLTTHQSSHSARCRDAQGSENGNRQTRLRPAVVEADFPARHPLQQHAHGGWDDQGKQRDVDGCFDGEQVADVLELPAVPLRGVLGKEMRVG